MRRRGGGKREGPYRPPGTEAPPRNAQGNRPVTPHVDLVLPSSPRQANLRHVFLSFNVLDVVYKLPITSVLLLSVQAACINLRAHTPLHRKTQLPM